MIDAINSFLTPILAFDDNISSQLRRWSHLSAFRRLQRHSRRAISVGCENGWEALALSVFLGVQECVGVDIDETRIESCNRNLDAFGTELIDIQVKLRDLIYILDDTGVAINEELQTKIQMLTNRYLDLSLPKFLCVDLLQSDLSDLLPEEQFDLVYCRYILYHIFCNEGNDGHRNAETATRVISGLTKVDGLVVSIEPKKCSVEDGTNVELQDYFLRAGFSQFSDERLESQPFNTKIYERI